VYRGVERATFPLIPKVARFGWDIHLERQALDHFRLQAAARARPTPTCTLEWLSLGQHHGLATRLLDWTTSALAALFFAVRKHEDQHDAALYIFEAANPVPLHNLPKKLREDPFDWGHTYFIEVDVHTRHAEARPMRPGAPAIGPWGYLFAPPVVSDRITAQSGLFSISAFPQAPHDELVEDSQMSRISIPWRDKITIFQALLRCGIHEQALFPDLDGIASHATALAELAHAKPG
jgi:hypothetical protein